MNSNTHGVVALGVACAVLASCQRGPALQESTVDRRLGAFEFTIRNGTSVFAGTLDAREDTMTVYAREGTCYADRLAPPVIDRLVFRCEGSTGVDGLRLSFDRRNPQSRSRWSGTVLQRVTRTECTAYRIDERGQRVCTASRTISEETSAPVSGSIMLQWKMPVP